MGETEEVIEEESFEEYMENFKKCTLKEKQSIIIEQLQTLSAFTNNLCKEINVDNEMLINRELVDVKNDNYTEDDFAEAVLVYINSIQDSICAYSSGITDVLDAIDSSIEQ